MRLFAAKYGLLQNTVGMTLPKVVAHEPFAAAIRCELLRPFLVASVLQVEGHFQVGSTVMEPKLQGFFQISSTYVYIYISL